MGVPKKRKKLDSAVEPELVGVVPDSGTKPNQSGEGKPVKKSGSKSTKSKSKVDKAFEVVDKIDKNMEESKMIEVKKVNFPVVFEEQGVHISFRIDLIDWEAIFGNNNKQQNNAIVLDFTLPYIWNLPVFKEVTQFTVFQLKKFKILP